MPIAAFALPVAPGRTEAVRELAREVYGPRRAEFREHDRAFGITREEWFLQSTPAGDLLLVVFEAEDVGRMFTRFGASQTPFDTWFKQQIQAFSGHAPITTQPVESLGSLEP